MSASRAPGGSIIAIGSPGTTRNTMKTITATPKRVRGQQQAAQEIAARQGALLRGLRRLGSRLADRLRQQKAGDVGRHLQPRTVDDGLHVLEERNDVALLGDVAVGGLVPGDALGLVLLAP